MNTLVSRFGMCGLLVLLTLVSGVVLSNSGKPHNTMIFNIHKLIAVGTVIFMGVSIYNLYTAGNIHALHVSVFAITGLFFLILIISGGLLSVVAGGLLTLDDGSLQAVLRIHQIVPLLALAASMISLYLMAVGSEA